LSGQIGIDPQTGQLVSDDVRNQTHQVFRNIQAVLHAAGANLTQVARCLVLLEDMNDFQAVNQIYASYFPSIEDFPARSTFAVKTLPSSAKVEIECTAYTNLE
jgi:2-iminobutanoate/2-iminopropanoate deaminase